MLWLSLQKILAMQYRLLRGLALLPLCTHLVSLAAAQPAQEVKDKRGEEGLVLAVRSLSFAID